MAKQEANVKGLGKIYEARVSFEAALKELRTQDIRQPTSSRDLAYARIQEGKGSSLCSNGSYTNEGFEYAKGQSVLLKLKSRLSNQKLAKQAVEANRIRNYFSMGREIYEQDYEQAQKDLNKEPEKRQVLLLPSRKGFNITVNDDIAKGLFKDQAEKYFDFLGQDSLRVYLVDKNTVDNQDGVILTQNWLCNLDGRSGLDGDSWDLGYDSGVRGVSRKTSVAGSQKNVLPYTQRQVDKIAKVISGVKDGKFGTSKLVKALDFLEGLRE